jgi:hypothetical protein
MLCLKSIKVFCNKFVTVLIKKNLNLKYTEYVSDKKKLFVPKK